MREKKLLRDLRKLPKRVVLIVMLLLLILDLALMGLSFARYREEHSAASGVGVVGFAPTLVEGEFEGDFPATAPKEPLCFTVQNANREVGVRLTITVIPEGVLPLSYRLLLGETPLTLTQKDGALVATATMAAATAEQEFTLIAEWMSPEFDERFGGLSETVKIRVLCEQWQEG
jgi:hypothetical protein